MQYYIFAFLTLFLILPITALSQVEVEHDDLEYVGVIEVQDVSASDLYERSKVWFATRYRSANDVLQYDNRETAQIIGKANLAYDPSFLSGRDGVIGFVRYEVTITSRDGRFRYEFKNFYHEPTGYRGAYSVGILTTSDDHPNPGGRFERRQNNRVWNDIKNQVDETINALIEDLSNFMLESSDDDDW